MSDQLEIARARKFMHMANKNHCLVAGEMSQKIKDVVFSYADQIPLALVIGVLEVVKKEVLDGHDEEVGNE